MATGPKFKVKYSKYQSLVGLTLSSRSAAAIGVDIKERNFRLDMSNSIVVSQACWTITQYRDATARETDGVCQADRSFVAVNLHVMSCHGNGG
jgi:hypothetical protein